MINLENLFNRVIALEPVENLANGKPMQHVAQRHIERQLEADRQQIQLILVNFLKDLEFTFQYLRQDKRFQEMLQEVGRFEYHIRRSLPERVCKDLESELEKYKSITDENSVTISRRAGEQLNDTELLMALSKAMTNAGSDITKSFCGRLLFIP